VNAKTGFMKTSVSCNPKKQSNGYLWQFFVPEF